MVALYVTSSEKGSGKTTVCAGLAKALVDSGKTVGFFKPVISDSASSSAAGDDDDTAFMKHQINLAEPAELLNPVVTDKNIKDAYNKVSGGKDAVIIEAVSGIDPSSASIIQALDARVIVVDSYSTEPLKESVNYSTSFGTTLLGVVVNHTPPSMVDHIRDELSDRPDMKDVSILGVLPETRALAALTVGELAENIQGEILNNPESSAELVESIMLGGMSVDSGLEYMGRKANKAVVVRNERSDMQLAALETSTRCLVISGNSAPMPAITARAQEKSVPIILTGDDISTITDNLEKAVSDLKASGVEFTMDIREVRPGFKVSFLMAPENVPIELQVGGL